MNDSLKRSLTRLGEVAALDFTPEIFVEHELALAVRRFGVRRVLLRMLKGWWFLKTIRFRSQPEEIKFPKLDAFLKELGR